MKEALRSFYRPRCKKTAQKRLSDLVAITMLSEGAAMA